LNNSRIKISFEFGISGSRLGRIDKELLMNGRKRICCRFWKSVLPLPYSFDAHRSVVAVQYSFVVPLVSFFASFIPNFFYRHGCIGIRFGCYHSIIADMAAVMVVEGAENAMMLRFEIF
jgi:hypothetical protein